MCTKRLVVTVVSAFLSLVIFSPAAVYAKDKDFDGPPSHHDCRRPAENWSQILPGSERFVVVLNGAGVLDKETGLVWQRSPDAPTWDWNGARAQCASIEIGGRLGWHLPTVEQLTSLIDRTSTNGRMVPEDNPFGLVRVRHPYWTASPYPGAPGYSMRVDFADGTTLGAAVTELFHVWCVRGGQAANEEP
ncbi:hypothetical protein GMSM_27520 [Geomonas sp. Red276]